MYTYHNVSAFNDEQDFLLKFVEKEATSSKANLKKTGLKKNSKLDAGKLIGKIFSLPANSTFSINFTAHRLFEVIDVNSDGFIDWYDFGFFYQTLYLFSKFDTFQKGKIVAGELYEKYFYYSGFPRVSSTLRHRAKRFNLINQDTYIDVFNALVILRIDDIVSLYTRKTDPTTLYEVELKRVLNKVNLNYINDGLLNRCLREMDSQNVPKYDWECAFMAAIQDNINYLESASMYNTAKAHNITLVNTAFYNLDPALNITATAKTS